MMAHLVDGTYELFRHYYGRRRFEKDKPAPFGAVTGVLHTVLEMIEKGATHLGVATDHVIESFRNGLWPGYKTAQGIDPRAARAVPPAGRGPRGHGRRRLADGRARSGRRARLRRRLAAADAGVQKVCIWTPDKDLAQCVRDDRVVQVDRRGNKILTAEGVRAKFGVIPR